MFEQTLLEGSRAGQRRQTAVSIALSAHLAIAVAIAVASLLVVEQIQDPPELAIIFRVQRLLPVDSWEPPSHLRPAPPSGGSSSPAGPAFEKTEDDPPAADEVQEVAPVDVVPRSIEELDLTSPTDLAGEGSGPDGADGGGDGDGPGDGDGDGGNGTGTGSEGEGSGDGPPGDGPFTVGGEVEAPVLRYRVEPTYPEAARRARFEGRVVLQAIIGVDGTVEHVVVVSSTNRLFEAAAIDAVQKWVYRPGTRGGVPVPVYFSVLVHFTLH